MAAQAGSSDPPDAVIGLVEVEPLPSESDPLPARLSNRKRGRWTVRVDDDPEDRIALDLSVGGLFLSGPSLPAGTRLQLTLLLPPDACERLVLVGTVRWSRQGRLVPRALRGVGVAFDDLDEPTRARLVAELEVAP